MLKAKFPHALFEFGDQNSISTNALMFGQQADAVNIGPFGTPEK